MATKIVKRDKTVELFSEDKIYDAIFMAASDAGLDFTDATQVGHDVTALVAYAFSETETVNIYDVEREIENTLMDDAYWKPVARKFIEYRHDRQQARDLETNLHKNIVGLVDQTDPDILNENANKEATAFNVQRDLLAGELARHYGIEYLLPREVARQHLAGNIHFHDLDYFPLMGMTNCCLVDLEGMLSSGFKMGNAHIETPKSIQTAATIVSQIAAAVASSQYGGTSFDRLDEVLAPYVTMTYETNLHLVAKIAGYWGGEDDTINHVEIAKEMTEKAVFDACQTLEYQVNTIYCSNGQTPFLTFGFGLGDTWEAKLVQKGILQNRINGLGKEGATAIFPKLVFALKEGHNLNPEDSFYDVKQLALKCASERMYPDILSYKKTVEITGGFKTPMGCRSFLSTWHDDKGVETYAGRNNLGVVSLNLPKFALEANGDIEKFWLLFDEYLELAHDALKFRLERLSTVQAKSAPIMYMEGALGLRLDPDEFVLPHLIKRGASISIGYIGIEEMCTVMFGSDEHLLDSEEKQVFALEVMRELDSATKKWKKEEGIGYSVYGTPSESLCNRFCKAIVSQYGQVENVTEKGYLTNSFHLDVQKQTDPYSKYDFESQFVPYSSGGHINYVELPNMQRNLEALENVWDYAYHVVPYYGVNTPIDHCYDCDFKGEFTCTSKGFTCPSCGNHNPETCSVTRRVSGYLGNPGTRPFNDGKQSEMTKRVKHYKD